MGVLYPRLVLVPDALVCQYHLTLAGGVPLYVRVTEPHVLPEEEGPGGVDGFDLTVTATLAEAVLQQPALLLALR